MNNVKIFIGVIIVLVIGVVITAVVRGGGGAAQAGEYDSFAMCLQEKGAIFYGAFWCPHCQDQKKMFGSSAKLLPYVECSTLDGRGQNAECTEKNIASYPTWEFADGTREVGEMTFAELAEKTGCPLPTDATNIEVESGGSSKALPQ